MREAAIAGGLIGAAAGATDGVKKTAELIDEVEFNADEQKLLATYEGRKKLIFNFDKTAEEIKENYPSKSNVTIEDRLRAGGKWLGPTILFAAMGAFGASEFYLEDEAGKIFIENYQTHYLKVMNIQVAYEENRIQLESGSCLAHQDDQATPLQQPPSLP
jgi:hypothetical protein